ncbi:nucleoside/nucleotide kinase family protein [Cryobacterium glaciale]|uniref:nucleoside/nucleotide kinase family protein n=1 Tax=Cryobacterium glaciale TaxID=1259145 RepID=UPI001F546FC2|nr:nucleoside/nucleotide kinase family protein [Cryobacterium glaciale]
MPETDPAPTAPPASAQLTELARRVIDLMPEHGRILVGNAGSPGAGKSTLAMTVAAKVNELLGSPAIAVHLPMDGFHLANATLDRLGRHDRKGAVDTSTVGDSSPISAASSPKTTTPSTRRASIAASTRASPPRSPCCRATEWSSSRETICSPALNPGCRSRASSPTAGSARPAKRSASAAWSTGTSAMDAPAAALAWAESVDGQNALLIEATRPRATLTISGQ